MYSNDPIYWQQKPVKPVRLWPYVLAGLLLALAVWGYYCPVPTLELNESQIPRYSKFGG